MKDLQVARGTVSREGRSFVGRAIPLEDHHRACTQLLKTMFSFDEADAELRGTLDWETLLAVAKRHDMYKPYTMRVLKDSGEYRLGFRGHPYRISFTDFEDALMSPAKVAVATSLARLHHFINMRDVERFIETLGLAKTYLKRRGVHVPLAVLRRAVLRGLIPIHVVDMVAGFLEEAVLRGRAPEEVRDTDTAERVEPHIPVSVILSSGPGTGFEATIAIHGLKRLANPEILGGQATLTLTYRVFEGIYADGRRFEAAGGPVEHVVRLRLLHKYSRIMEVVQGV